MKLYTILENTTSRKDLLPEHGLSLYVETGSRKLLFDTGQSGRFWDNADRLGLQLTQVDTVVLSHGHYDHGGGLGRFLECNEKARIFVSAQAFGAYYHGPEKYIGLSPALRDNPRIQAVDRPLDLGDGLSLIPDIPLRYPVRSYGLQKRQGGRLVPDDFVHEQYLLLEEGGRRILFSGCSHRGILNIADYFRPDVLIGGFHFMKLDPDAPDGRRVLEQSARILLDLPCTYYTCHCTGLPQYEFLKTILGDRLHYLSTGSQLNL